MIIFKLRRLELEVYTKAAGLFSVGFVYNSYKTKFPWSIAFHFLPKRRDRIWGYHKEWYDGPLYYLGLGPLMLICWGG